MDTYDPWPAYAPDQILPRLYQGGTEDDHVVGEAIPADHYRGERPFDLIVTLYADAQPAPWAVPTRWISRATGVLPTNETALIVG